MTFFERQQAARRKTWILVAYFLAAVVLICIAVNAAVYMMAFSSATPPPTLASWLQKPVWLWISAATLSIIVIGTLKTMFRLRGGGRAVAEMVGARRVNTATTDLNERRLINVVEEMSIASGTPVPATYVMDNESAINAFVAGLRPTEAVLVVTRGTLETLDRDELQGVVAHEYSHVLNGDMRINLRLMGVLAGILLIGQLGRVLLRSGGRSRGKGGGQAVMLGLALFIIGYIGLFFGALIKAAISRQREFLADASAVQFTRNPPGIAGALWKIQQHGSGSHLGNAHSEDISHFCFGESVSAGFTSLMATHPPLDIRIKAIDPHFVIRKRARQAAKPSAEVAPEKPAVAARGIDSSTAIDTSSGAVMANIGQVSPAQIGFAAAMLAGISDPVQTAVHSADGARHIIYALLLTAIDRDQRDKGHSIIRDAEGDAGVTAVEQLRPLIQQLGARARLPLVNMTLPTLKAQDEETRGKLLAIAQALIEADRRYTIFEFALITVLRGHLAENAEQDVAVKFHKFDQVMGEIHLLISVMARVSSMDEQQINATFRNVMAQFDRKREQPVSKSGCTLTAVSEALQSLNQLTPLLKEPVIQACADCVIHDGKVLPPEADMLQAVAVSLDCPMPPLIQPQPQPTSQVGSDPT